MTAFTAPSRILRSAEFQPYIQRVGSTPLPEIGLVNETSQANGWKPDYQLRCLDLSYGVWPRSSVARFDHVSASGRLAPIEETLGEYWLDDMVRLVGFFPLAGTSAAVDPTSGGGGEGVVLFEGVLQRQSFRVQTAGGREDEGMQLVAIDGPTIDNLAPEHLIRGRWIQDLGQAEGTITLIDTPGVPAVFNRGGMPNMMSPDQFDVDDEATELDLQASAFTFDGDYRAQYWTLRKALLSILVYWLYGRQGEPLTRSSTLEWYTYQALTGLDETAGGGAERWTGLDAILPEVDVQGLGVYDALARVCAAGGFEMAIAPRLGRPAPTGDGVVAADRLYEIRIWRAGGGPENTLKLRKRVDALVEDLPPEEELAQNNVNILSALRDATGVRNHVVAVGRTLLEVTVPLKPLWSPDDVSSATVNAELHGKVEAGSAASEYTQRHTSKGSDFGDYGHVGRLWGIDCTGSFSASGYGSGDALYHHDPDGFDWLALLGIDGEDDLTAARTAGGVTDPIAWTRRERRALPLNRPGTDHMLRPYRLEASEDGGETWTEINLGNALRVQRESFAVFLEIPNLAEVNTKTFSGDVALASTAELSYWKLITTKALQFRLTCLIEADHAARYDALPGAGTSGTLHNRAIVVESDVVEVWSSPDSLLNDGSTWERIHDGGYSNSTAGADRSQNLEDLAKRVRDTQGLTRIALSAATWVMDPGTFAVGDTIPGIDGRSLGLGRAVEGGDRRSPSIIGWQMIGWPEQAQGIQIDIGDSSLRRGV